MEAIIKTFKNVREQVVPNYNDRLQKADETLVNALIAANGQEKEITLTFVDLVNLRTLIHDMKSAVYMLDKQLESTIANLETTQEMMNRKPGRPKQDGG